VGELTTVLELTDEQQEQVSGLLVEFMGNLAAATDQAEDAEADPQKMLSDVKAVRADFNGKMKNVLTKDQWKAYEALIDSIFQEVFEGIAALKIMDLQPVLELTDEQAEQLEPVVGTAMRGMVGVLVEYGDQKLNTRTKLKMAKALKKISGDMNSGMQQVLSPEQWEQYQAMKEAAKE
jgi:hypothetical protein